MWHISELSFHCLLFVDSYFISKEMNRRKNFHTLKFESSEQTERPNYLLRGKLDQIRKTNSAQLIS